MAKYPLLLMERNPDRTYDNEPISQNPFHMLAMLPDEEQRRLLGLPPLPEPKPRGRRGKKRQK